MTDEDHAPRYRLMQCVIPHLSPYLFDVVRDALRSLVFSDSETDSTAIASDVLWPIFRHRPSALRYMAKDVLGLNEGDVCDDEELLEMFSAMEDEAHQFGTEIGQDPGSEEAAFVDDYVDDYEDEELEPLTGVYESVSSVGRYSYSEQQAKPLAEQSLDDFDGFFRRCKGLTFIFLAEREVNTVYPNVVEAIRLMDCSTYDRPFKSDYEAAVSRPRDSFSRPEIESEIRDRVAEMNRRGVDYALIWSLAGDGKVHADGTEKMLDGHEIGWLLVDEVQDLFECWGHPD